MLDEGHGLAAIARAVGCSRIQVYRISAQRRINQETLSLQKAIGRCSSGKGRRSMPEGGLAF
jgi:DNA invertase Pin-like site-specific DNA recombinase